MSPQTNKLDGFRRRLVRTVYVFARRSLNRDLQQRPWPTTMIDRGCPGSRRAWPRRCRFGRPETQTPARGKKSSTQALPRLRNQPMLPPSRLLARNPQYLPQSTPSYLLRALLRLAETRLWILILGLHSPLFRHRYLPTVSTTRALYAIIRMRHRYLTPFPLSPSNLYPSLRPSPAALL